MPATKPWSSAEFNDMLAQVTPDILALLGDGVPRSRGAILAALAGRHAREEVRSTLMRLAVTEQLVETGGRYTLSAPGTTQVSRGRGIRRASCGVQAGSVSCWQSPISSGKLAMLDLARALPPWYRQRALADLDRLLAQLEGGTPSSPRQTRQRRAAAQQAARSAAPEDRLVLLRQSRQVLLAAQSEPEAKAA